MFIANLDREEGLGARLLAMIERNAPRLMKEGGGAIRREIQKCGQALTKEQRAKIITMAQSPLNYSQGQIAVAVGCAHGTACKYLRKMGIAPAHMTQGKRARPRPPQQNAA